MMRLINGLPSLLFVICLISCSNEKASSSSLKGIYGTDDRKDLYDLSIDPKMLHFSRSTGVVLGLPSLVKDSAKNTYNIQTTFFNQRIYETDDGKKLPLCDTVPFRDQPDAGECSGFLVEDDIFATAGHCVKDDDECLSMAVVFDYAYLAKDTEPTVDLSPNNVFFCKKLITRSFNFIGADYALFRLDRPTHREPLKLRAEGSVQIGDPMTVIGYPNGLPAKVAAGAIVRKNNRPEFFVVSSDTFAGNSGSAVINSSTGLVEGMIVRGDTDYVENADKTCMTLNICPEDGCNGEDVTRSTEIVTSLKKGSR